MFNRIDFMNRMLIGRTKQKGLSYYVDIIQIYLI